MIEREVLRELKKNKIRIEEEKTTFKEKVRISHKVMGSAKISHSCGSPRQRACFFWKMVIKAISHKVRIPVHFRTEIFDGDREHAFWKMLTKAISHQGVEWCEFCTRELGGANFAGSWLFSPVFSLTSFFKLSYLHVNTKTNSNHIRMKLRSKIKIKTCINTRKTLD